MGQLDKEKEDNDAVAVVVFEINKMGKAKNDEREDIDRQTDRQRGNDLQASKQARTRTKSDRQWRWR